VRQGWPVGPRKVKNGEYFCLRWGLAAPDPFVWAEFAWPWLVVWIFVLSLGNKIRFRKFVGARNVNLDS
jgi:hypothetical protein